MNVLLFAWLLVLAFVQTSVAAEVPKVPGVVIHHSPQSSGIYIGSPGIAVLADGTYLAKCDEFGPGSTEHELAVTKVFRSTDRGRTWTPWSDVKGMYWASIFEHRGAIFLIGPNKHQGQCVIRRSNDGGRTWTTPSDADSGLLIADESYHCAPVPVVLHGGRIWRAMEDTKGPGGWGTHFRALMMSAPAEADLLKASNWTISERMGGKASWLEGHFGGWLEGNAVITPEGSIVDFLRVDYRVGTEKAAMIQVSADGKRLSFDPASGFVDFPGGCKKFTIRFDAQSGRYWSLANYVPPRHRSRNPERARNTVALTSSADLRHWEVRCVPLYHPDTATHGFQYLDWLFEGNDLIVISRTAFDDGEGGAHNQHDANYLTFHRIQNFRTLTPSDSVPEIRKEIER